MATTNDPKVIAVRVGADIGQRQDYTAIAVTEEQDRRGIEHYVTRSIERLPLQTPYPTVANHIVAIVQALKARSEAWEYVGKNYPVECWVDATGVGLPIVDLVREAGVSAKSVILTGTDTLTERRDDVISLGKGYMVGRLQVILQADRLHLPISEDFTPLIAELQDYHGSQNPQTGHVSYNAKTAHDDMVIALALSVGEGRRGRGEAWSGSWLPEFDEDDYRHPNHVPPWIDGRR